MANEFKIKKGLIVTGADGGTVVDIQGSQGQLFSVTDDLSGSIFAVSDISGVPILDINSSGLSTFDGNLDINGSALTITNLSSPMIKLVDTTSNLQARFRVANSYAYLSVDNPDDVVSSRLVFQVDGNEALHLDASQDAIFAGEVSLKSRLNLQRPSGGATTLIQFKNEIGVDRAHIDFGGTNEELSFFAGDGTTENMTINSSGNATFAGAVAVNGSYLTVANASNPYIYVNDTNAGSGIFQQEGNTTRIGSDSNTQVVLVQNNATAVTIDTSKNVGINTTLPDFKLDVDGTFGVSDLPFNASSTSVLVANEALSAELVTNGDFDTETNWFNQTGTNWSISGGKASVSNTGNVRYFQQSGVLPNPSANKSFLIKWTISGLTQGGIGVNVGGYTTTTIQTSNGTYEQEVTPTNASSNTLVYLQSNANTIGSVDNVSVKEITSASNQIQKRELGTGAFGPTPVGAYLPLSAGSGEILTGDLAMNNNIGIITKDSSGAFRDILKLNSSNVLEIGSSSLATDTIFKNTGNVGIGTTDPGTKLELFEVSGGAPTLLTLHQYAIDIVADDSMGSFIDFKSTDINANFTPQARIGMRIRDSGGDSGVDSEGCGNLVFHTSRGTNSSGDGVDVERMRITDIGNVGIGTSTPSQKLTIRDDSANVYSTGDAGTNTGDFVLQNNNETNDNFNRISFQSNSDNNPTDDLLDAARITAIYPDHAGGNPSGELAFETKADAGSMAEAMRIDRDGNVGIGTDSPQSKLHIETGSGGTYNPNVNHDDVTIEGSGNIGLQLFSPATSYQYIAFGDPNSVNAGYLRYYHETNQMVFRTNGSDNMVIKGDGNVGIGETNPASKLSIASTGTNAYSATLDSASNMKGIRNVITSNADDMVGVYFATGTTTSGVHWSGITGSRTDGSGVHWGTQLNFYTHNNDVANLNHATQKMVIKGDGNVGINTTTPGSKLVVAGGTDTAYNDGTLKVVGSIALNAANNLNPSLNRWVLRPRAAGVEGSFDIYDARHSLSRLTIVNSGNVGIGEADPTAKLEVYHSGGTAFNVTGSQGQLFSVTDDLSGDIFSVADISGVPIMNVNSDGTSYFDGDVGIGTDSPNAKLHINTGATYEVGSLSGSMLIEPTGVAFNGYGAGIVLGAGRGRRASGGAAIASVLDSLTDVDRSGLSFFYHNSTFSDPRTEGMRLDASGNVGVGTTSPGAKLDVNSSISSSSADVIKLSQNTNGAVKAAASLGISVQNGGEATNAADLWFTTATNGSLAERMRITSGGNVGINVTNPSDARLKVLGNVIFDGHNTGDPDSISRTAYPADQMFTHYTNNGVSIIGGKGSYTGCGLTIGEETGRSSNFKFIRCVSDTNGGASAAEEFWVNGVGDAYFAGNVGIGTGSPATYLQIGAYPNSNINITTYPDIPSEHMIHLTAPETTGRYGGGISFGENTFTAANITAQDAGGNGSLHMLFGTRHTSGIVEERMRITSEGYVGINTTTPGYLLDVRDGISSGAIARFSAVNAHVIIESSTAGPAVLHLKPNVTGNKSGQFKVTTGEGYNFRWSNDAANTAEVTYMKLDTSTTGGGDLTVKGDIIAYGAPSDERYKENIKPIESALDKALKLQGVTFDWKESDSILDIKEDIGFIAQDVQKVIPELVRENEDGKLSLRYQGITPILLEAIKELKAEIEELKKQIK